MKSKTAVSQYSLVHRPKTFEDVRGQEGIIREFKKRSKLNNFPSAMLFQGPTGVGKTTLAFLAAASIQCQHKDDEGNPCGECASCKDIFEESFSRGTMMLDGGSSSKDDVIQLIEQTVHSKPLNSPKYVFIIEEVDQLSTAAKNAFHKILEKPSPYVHFILLSMTEGNGNKVPVSIADRCQPYHFKNLSEKDIAYTLKGILEKEGRWEDIPTEFKKEGIFLLVNNAKGSLRRAVQFLERAMLGEFYSVADIEDNFKFVSEAAGLSILQHIIKGKSVEFNKELEEMRRENKLADWVHMVNYFCLRHRQNLIAGEDFDQSPSSSLLKKMDKAKFLVLNFKVRAMAEELRHGSYMTSTHIAHMMIDLFNGLVSEPEPPTKESIPIRGSSK